MNNATDQPVPPSTQEREEIPESLAALLRERVRDLEAQPKSSWPDVKKRILEKCKSR